MLPIKLEVTNFTSYLHEIIDFTQYDSANPILIMGENGAGKSSIIDMITVAIFYRCHGVLANGSGMDDLIHQGSDFFEIKFDFAMNNHLYTIIRHKTKKSQTLKLFIDNIDCSGKLQETQQKILDIFKIDYDTFMDTVIMGQTQSIGFVQKSPLDRKKVIAQILGLDKYDILENYTKSLKKDEENKLNILQLELQKLDNTLLNKEDCLNELNQLKTKLKPINDNISKLEKKLEEELIEKAKYEELKKQQNVILNEKQQNIKLIESTNNELNKAIAIQNDMQQYINKKDETRTKIRNLNLTLDNLSNTEKEKSTQKIEINAKINILNTNLSNIKTKFSHLKHYNKCECEFCGQQISNEYKEKYLLDLKNKGVDLQNQIKFHTDVITNLQNEIESINTEINSKKQEVSSLTLEYNKIEKAEIKIDSVKEKILELNKKLDTLNKKKLEYDQLDLQILDNKTFNDFVLRNEIQELRNKLMSYNKQINIIEINIANIEKNEEEIKSIKSQYAEKKEYISILSELQKSWGKKGIQSAIIDNILPQIEDEINKYLSILSNGNISITFKTIKEAKNGNKSDTLDVIVKDQFGERPYERYSGGEKMRVNFACHIGMSKFLAKRSGANIDLFVVDEGIGSLDDTGKDDFVETVKSLTLIFKKVMIISHISDIKESFINKLYVYKDLQDGSKVKKIC